MIKFKNMFKKESKVEVEVNNPTNGLEDLPVKEEELSLEDLNEIGGGAHTMQYYYEKIHNAKDESERKMWEDELNRWMDEQRQGKGGRHV